MNVKVTPFMDAVFVIWTKGHLDMVKSIADEVGASCKLKQDSRTQEWCATLERQDWGRVAARLPSHMQLELHGALR